MKLLGAEVTPALSGSRTLKDAMNEALRDWVTNVDDTFYMHRHGRRPASLSADGARLPVGHRPRGARADAGSARAACPTRWSPASAAAPTPSACSIPSSTTGAWRSTASRRRARASTSHNGHAASITGGRPGVLHGNRTYLLQDDDGQILEGHSISAGLDYPGIGPEHSWLHDIGPGELCVGHRRGGAGGVPAVHAAGGHHPGARARARAGPRDEARADANPRTTSSS